MVAGFKTKTVLGNTEKTPRNIVPGRPCTSAILMVRFLFIILIDKLVENFGKCINFIQLNLVST